MRTDGDCTMVHGFSRFSVQRDVRNREMQILVREPVEPRASDHDPNRRHLIARRAAQSRAATRGSIAPTWSTSQAQAGDRVVVRGPRGRDARARALQRPVADRDPDADARRRRWPTMRCCAQRIERRSRFVDSLAIDATAYRLVHGEADLLPSLDRRSLRRLPRRADAVAGAWIACCRSSSRRSTICCIRAGILARNDPRTRLLKGSSSGSTCWRGAGDGSTVVEGGIEYDVDLAHGPEDGSVPRSAREPRSGVRCYARGRLLDCFSYHGGFALTLGAARAPRRWRSTFRRTRSPGCD